MRFTFAFPFRGDSAEGYRFVPFVHIVNRWRVRGARGTGAAFLFILCSFGRQATAFKISDSTGATIDFWVVKATWVAPMSPRQMMH